MVFYVINEYEDGEYYPTTFDMIRVVSDNPVRAGIQHNEPYGRNSHCNFGVQERGIIDLCQCGNISDQLPGWAHPDCPKMLPQYDSGALADILQRVLLVTCDECGNLVPAYTIRCVDDNALCQECFDDSFFVCRRCGETVLLDDESSDYDNVCIDCADDVVSTCDNCGEIIYEEDDYWYDDDHYLCEECYPYHTFPCDWCGERYHNDYMQSDDNISICDGCYDDACRCEDCGSIIPLDESYSTDDAYYCRDCWNEYHRNRSDHVHDYGYAPCLRFLRTDADVETGVPFYGIELEVDQDEDDYDNYQACAEELSQFRDIWMTTDGSLSEVGIELKTMPASYDYHMKQLPWSDIVRVCKDNGYRSHAPGNCGLHIHISKEAFGHEPSERDASMAKFLFMVERFWDQMVVFSRRTNDSLRRWARQYELANVESCESIAREIYDKNHMTKHFCVNLMQSNTVEVRIFRGTLKTDTIKASIQLCDMMREMSTSLSLDTIQRLTWDTFKQYSTTGKYPELVEYFDRRGL